MGTGAEERGGCWTPNEHRTWEGYIGADGTSRHAALVKVDGPQLCRRVTKDLPTSSRFTPNDFLLRCKFSTLTTRHPMVEFTYSRSLAFRYGRKNTNFGNKNRTHDFRTSRCTGYLLDHSSDEGIARGKGPRSNQGRLTGDRGRSRRESIEMVGTLA